MGQLKGSWEVKEGREMTGTGEMGFFFFFLSTQYARYRVRCRGSNVNEVPLPWVAHGLWRVLYYGAAGFELESLSLQGICVTSQPPLLASWEYGSPVHSFIPPNCRCREVLTGFFVFFFFRFEKCQSLGSDKEISKVPTPKRQEPTLLSLLAWALLLLPYPNKSGQSNLETIDSGLTHQELIHKSFVES